MFFVVKITRVETSGVNFTNIIRAALMLADPKSAKKLLDLMIFFALLVSAQIKAAHKMLMKLTPEIEIIGQPEF